MNDTIAAIATPLLPSAIGILRLSGPGSIAAADRVFTPFHGGPMGARPDRMLVYGALRDADGAVIDHCLCTVSHAPGSYTGEDTAELQCHGSPAALALGLEALFTAGARQALPGEFTRRAFLNGRLRASSAGRWPARWTASTISSPACAPTSTPCWTTRTKTSSPLRRRSWQRG